MGNPRCARLHHMDYQAYAREASEHQYIWRCCARHRQYMHDTLTTLMNVAVQFNWPQEVSGDVWHQLIILGNQYELKL